MKKPRARGPRLTALEALADVLDHGRNLADSPALQPSKKHPEDARDLSLARHLAYGVLRWLTALDWLANALLNKPFKSRDRDLHRLVLLGLQQLWHDQTAPHAAIHETAECARHLNKPWAVGVVNALLRRFQREQEDWLSRLATQPQQFAHPDWMVQRLRADWPDHWQQVLQANNAQAPLWLRLNRSGPERENVIERLEDDGFEVEPHPLAADAIKVTPAAPVTALPGFSQGHLSVQDPAAQLAAELLDASGGMRVLDACAAPGGKTCHILEHAKGALVTALELHAERAELIRQNLQRLHLKCTVLTGDASEPDSWWDGKPFQRILLDAPCSATGVIRRHPEIKHLRTPGQVDEAVQLQQRLLQQLWPLLEPGGILVYATCSLFKAENSMQIKNFVHNTANAEEQVLQVDWGIKEMHGRQILTGEKDMDGFYYAVLRKSD